MPLKDTVAGQLNKSISGSNDGIVKLDTGLAKNFDGSGMNLNNELASMGNGSGLGNVAFSNGGFGTDARNFGNNVAEKSIEGGLVLHK